LRQPHTSRALRTRGRLPARAALVAAGVALASVASGVDVRQRSTYRCTDDGPGGLAAASLPGFTLARGEGVYLIGVIVGASGRIYATGPMHYVDETQTVVMTPTGGFVPAGAAASAVELPHHLTALPEPTSAYTFFRSTFGGPVSFSIALDDDACAGGTASRQGPARPSAPPREVLASLELALPAPAR
jgi:hypothetical protein